MTLREKIADWISGGALTRRDRVLVRTEEWRSECAMWAHKEIQIRKQYETRIDAALAEIDRQKKPNATVSRIGRILRGEQ
jgi:hypothetical protein